MPLRGRRVLITRRRQDAGELAALLSASGAELCYLPLLRIAPVIDSSTLDDAIARLDDFDWVVFSSRNAVERLCLHMRERGDEPDAHAWPRVACVGPGTAEAARQAGLSVALLPERHDAAGLAEAMIARRRRMGDAVFLPQADNAQPLLRDRLAEEGYEVTAVACYRSLPEESELPESIEALDCVCFASAATVARFCERLDAGQFENLRQRGCAFVAIGEQTADGLRAHALPVSGIAAEPSAAGLAEAVLRALSRD